MSKAELSYREGADGMQYPELQMGNPRYDKPLGKYGMMAKRHMREHRPVQYQTLLMDGTLMEHLYRLDTQAHEMLETVKAQLMKQTPSPQTDDYMERYRYNQSLLDQAEEIVLHQMVYSS